MTSVSNLRHVKITDGYLVFTGLALHIRAVLSAAAELYLQIYEWNRKLGVVC